MKQSIDPFEAAFEEPEDLPDDDFQAQLETPGSTEPLTIPEPPLGSSGINASNAMNDEEEEEEENIDAVFQSIPMSYSGDPDKLARTKAIVSQLTEDQMDRYECFRRSRFRKSDMRRLLLLITGMRTISEPMIVAVSATTKMLVGEIVETARIVMTERKDSGPIRPCHIREAYRRLKLEGKVLRRTVPRLLL